MKICKYCKKPILDNCVWNPDSEGNGYHNACLCEMEFRSRDRQIYDKGRTDVLDKIRAEIEALPTNTRINWDGCCPDIDYPEIEYVDVSKARLLEIINKYKAESEVKDA